MYHFKRFLTNICDIDLQDVVLDRIVESSYTFEDVKNIFSRLDLANMPKSCKETFIKEFFQSLLSAEDSTTETIKSLKETLDLLSKECNNGKPFAVVVDVNGKLLTGEVYYNEYFDFYTETEEEMREKIMEEIFSDPLEYGIRHKDDFMDIDGQHDATIYELIDLNKKS
jgi:hypothetical protein